MKKAYCLNGCAAVRGGNCKYPPPPPYCLELTFFIQQNNNQYIYKPKCGLAIGAARIFSSASAFFARRSTESPERSTSAVEKKTPQKNPHASVSERRQIVSGVEFEGGQSATRAFRRCRAVADALSADYGQAVKGDCRLQSAGVTRETCPYGRLI